VPDEPVDCQDRVDGQTATPGGRGQLYEYAAFCRRVVRAYARRVGTGDVEALAPMLALATELDECVRQAVAGLREFGYSWAEIANRLGVTRQAAHQRWAAPTPSDPTQATPLIDVEGAIR
jgi:hypothetical protein